MRTLRRVNMKKERNSSNSDAKWGQYNTHHQRKEGGDTLTLSKKEAKWKATTPFRWLSVLQPNLIVYMDCYFDEDTEISFTATRDHQITH